MPLVTGPMGTRFFLRVYSYNEGHRLLSAGSLQNLALLLAGVCRQFRDLELKELLVGCYTSPPATFLQRKLQKDWEAVLERDRMVAYEACFKLIRSGHLPAEEDLEICTSFVDSDTQLADHEPDEYELLYHFDCRNCRGSRIKKIKGKPLDSFLADKSRAEWLRLKAEKESTKTYHVCDQLQPKETLYYVQLDGGHHRGGISIHQWDNTAAAVEVEDVVCFIQGSFQELPSCLLDVMQRAANDEQLEKRVSRARAASSRLQSAKKLAASFKELTDIEITPEQLMDADDLAELDTEEIPASS